MQRSPRMSFIHEAIGANLILKRRIAVLRERNDSFSMAVLATKVLLTHFV